MILRNFITTIISICALCVVAQTPFEKDGKWGLKDATSNKVIVKPQYLSLDATTDNSLFIVSKNVKSEYRGEQLQYGVINSLGKVIVPIKSDSISMFHGNLIAHGTKYVPINDTKMRPFSFFQCFSNDGTLLSSFDGNIEKLYKGGFIANLLDIPNRKPSKYLFNTELNKLSTSPISIIETSPKFVLIQDDMYVLYNTDTFLPVVSFSKYYSYQPNIMIIENNHKYGVVNMESGIYIEPTYSSLSHNSEKFVNESRTILYDAVNKEATAIDSNGKYLNGKVVYDNNYVGNYIFLDISDKGTIQLGGIDYEEVQPVVNNRDLYSVKNDGKWGLYNSDTKELLIPFKLPSPISNILRDSIVVINIDGTSSLYNKYGQELLSATDGNIVDVDDGLVYIDNSWTPSGIYSINESKWIVPCSKYQSVLRLNGGNFAAKNGDTYYIISSKGAILNTIDNISNISNQDGEYFIRVIDKNGKLGLINKNNGSWIVKCLYENDIAWGNGEGKNRRFALTQKTNKGEQVIILTVGGQKIASQFFPYGTKQGVIRNYGRKYLYQSF